MIAREILQQAKSQGYAIGAFNAANIETLKAITQAASKLKAPIIIEASDGEVNYIGRREIAGLVKVYREELKIPIILNLDHAKTVESCEEAIDAGFDYVHFDGSTLPYEENVSNAKVVVGVAHSHGVLVEGEMDHIQGASGDLRDRELLQDSALYTNPAKAREFVLATGIDTFASFVGNSHGLYKIEKHIDLKLLKKVAEALPDAFLSLHGGSGINEKDIKAAVKLGIVKVNVNSELRVAYHDTLKEVLKQTSEVAVYKFMPKVIDAVSEVVERKIKLFGSDGKA